MMFFVLVKLFVFFVCLLFTAVISCKAQQCPANIFIITTDGFRWQEIFNGADSSLINNSRYVEDTSLIKDLYWSNDLAERRKKLMPFFWNVLATKGQLYGNRLYGNKVDVANIYKISYPGYNELLTGYPDPLVIPNVPIKNRNINILEYLDNMPGYHNKVAAFTSWNIFPSILNRDRNKLLLNSGYEPLGDTASEMDTFINRVQDSVAHKKHTRHDELTFLSAMEYIKKNSPRVVFISFGETDEFAHAGKYDKYLQQAAKVDGMIAELWYYVQTNSFYKNNTTFIIATDHGRGQQGNGWHTHGPFTKGSGQAWVAMIGPGITPEGEVKLPQQHYNKQIAGTVAALLREKFSTSHATGAPFTLPKQQITGNEINETSIIVK